MNTENVLGVLLGVPPENLGAFLRAIGDPAMQHPQGQGKVNLTKLGQDGRKLQFIGEHGVQTLADLRGDTPREKLVWQKLWEQLQALKTPEERRALVQKVLDEPSTVARERMFGIERRGPARKVTEAKADPTDPNWPTHVKDATKTVDKNLAVIEARGAKAGKTPAEARAAAIEAYATVLQVTERISGRWQEHQSLSQKTKVGILDQIDALGAQGGLPQGWTNNARGRIGEALYGPHGGLRQTSLPNPLHPVPAAGGKPERPGFSRLDDKFGPGERPGSAPGTSDWMEIKTHRIDEAPKKTDVSADAVAIAREHAGEALQDWHALLANQSTRGDGIVIQYAREPHNQATRQAMLDELFGPNSPITAVRFGDGPWIERSAARPNSPMPPIPKELAAGPIVGTNGKGSAPVIPPVAVPAGTATD
jgi:hypothetical protein